MPKSLSKFYRMLMLCFASDYICLKENNGGLSSLIGVMRSFLVLVNSHDAFDLLLFFILTLSLSSIDITMLGACHRLYML